jgi:hypothetical protein
MNTNKSLSKKKKNRMNSIKVCQKQNEPEIKRILHQKKQIDTK